MTLKIWLQHNKFSLLLLGLAALGTAWAVTALHKPGQLDVVTAQAMDMSAMRPPAGALPVTLARAVRGAAGTSVTYTGTVAAYNVQDVATRVTGTVTDLTIYPGQSVRAGQVVARIDAQENGARAAQAAADAQKALAGAQTAADSALQARAALAEASARVPAARAASDESQADADALQAAIPDAQAAVASAQANADYWTTEIKREKQLTDAGAASRQEYQSELVQAQAAQSGITQAGARLRAAQAQARAARAKVRQMAGELNAARQAQSAAEAGVDVARSQLAETRGGIASADASSREAAVLSGYTEVQAPVGGVVIERPAAPGSLVQAGTVLARVAEIDRVRAQANVAVDDLNGIGVGSPVTVILSNGRMLASVVTSVFPSADDQTHTAIVETVLDNPGHSLLPGAFVTLRFSKGGNGDALRVPASAVVRDGGQSYVWLARQSISSSAPARYRCEICGMTYSAADSKRNGYKDPMDGGILKLVAPSAESNRGFWTAHKVLVTVLGNDADDALLAPPVAGGGGGLNAGDAVITQNLAQLSEGMAVSALTPAPSPSPARSSPARSSPARSSPARSSPARSSPARSSPARSSPARSSLGRGEPEVKIYRCEKCGMTYSAADARLHHFIDPMDGGRLDPVK